MPRNWTKLASTYLVKNRWIRLREDKCLLPNNKSIDDYYVLEYSDWVNVVAITTNNDVVLVKQYRHGAGKVTLELPSGGVEVSDDDAAQTAQRELLEETGYRATKLIKLGVLSPNPATHTNKVHSFLAKGVVLSDKQNLDDTEDIEVVLMPLAELREQVIKGSFAQAMHVAAIFLALEKLKTQ